MAPGQFHKLIASSTAVQVGGLIATVAIGILLARGLGVEGYGEYGIAFAIITLLAVPIEHGLPRLVLREVASASGRNDWPMLFGAISWADRAALIASAAIITGAILVLIGDFDASLTSIELTILIGLPLLPLSAAAAIRTNSLMGLHFMVSGQLPIMLLRPALFALLLSALFYLRPSIDAAHAMALNVTTAIVALWAAHLLLAARLPDKPLRQTRHGNRWIRSSVSMAAIDAVRVVHGQIGILLLGLYASTADAGLFRVASSAVIFAVLPLTVLEIISSPQFARLFSLEKFDDLQRFATRAARIGAASVGGLTLFVMIFGKQFLAMLFGNSYEASYLPLLILCIGQCINSIFGMNSVLLVMANQEKRLIRALLLGLGANAAIAVALIPSLGTVGAALGMGGYLLVWNVVAWRDAHRLTGVNTAFIGNSLRG